MTPDSPAAADDASADLHELGVLFVHGIGEQQQGSTLVAFGEPLYRWLERWFDGIIGSWTHAGLTQAQESAWFHRHSASWWRDDDPGALADAFETRLRLAGHLNADVDADPTALPPLEHLQNDVAGGLLAPRVSLHDAQTRQASSGTHHTPSSNCTRSPRTARRIARAGCSPNPGGRRRSSNRAGPGWPRG